MALYCSCNTTLELARTWYGSRQAAATQIERDDRTDGEGSGQCAPRIEKRLCSDVAFGVMPKRTRPFMQMGKLGLGNGDWGGVGLDVHCLGTARQPAQDRRPIREENLPFGGE